VGIGAAGPGGGSALAGRAAVMLPDNVLEFARFALPAVFLLTATSLTILASHRWRWCLLALALQYAGVFLLVALHWPLALALVKVVAGWMAAVVLVIAVLNSPDTWLAEERTQPGGALFRLLAAGLVAMVVASIVPRVVKWMPGVEMEQVWGGLILIGIGLLHLGLTAQPLRVVLGLLTVLSGFEILYAAVETATLVAGLLAGVNLGLALVGAYLLASPSLGEDG
jgi:hypothetical protein